MAPYDSKNDTSAFGFGVQTYPAVTYCNGVAVCSTPVKEPEPPPPGWHQLFGGFAYKQDKPRPPKRQRISHRIGSRRKYR